MSAPARDPALCNILVTLSYPYNQGVTTALSFIETQVSQLDVSEGGYVT